MSTFEAFKNIVEELSKDPETEEKLTDLRKEIADAYVQKLKTEKSDLLLALGEDIVADYLVDEGFSDKLHDHLVEKALESVSSLSSDLKLFREKLKAATEDDLQKLKTEIVSNPESESQSPSQIDHASETQDENKTSDEETASKPLASTPSLVGERGDMHADARLAEAPQHQGNSEIEQKEQELQVEVSPEIEQFYNQLKGKEKPDLKPFALAMSGYLKLKPELKNPTYLSVVDFSLSNKEKRFYVINMEKKTVEITEQVGHGKNTGWEFAQNFSNKTGSLQSSLGFYRTPAEIQKANSKSRSGLKMKGIEDSNDNAADRGIYIHPAPVTGSEGCFTLPMKQQEANEIMDKLKWDSLLFAYYPDQKYVDSSKYLAA